MARNTNIKLRRSATSGAIPTTANLDLGELAINTYDGKLFLKKNVLGTESIVEIGSSTESQEAVWTEYVYTATAAQTTFSGSDDNSNTLSYTPLFLQVFLNGVLLDNGTDYTATSGSSVVLVNAASAGDLVQIASFVKVIGNGDIVVNSFTGDGSTAAYTLTADPDTEDNTTVFVDGVYQEKDTYTVSGTTLTFDANVPNGASIEILIGSRNVTLSGIADLNVTGDLTVDGESFFTGDAEFTGFVLGDVKGAITFAAQAGEALSKGDAVYISGISGNTTVVSKADADDAAKMPAFGIVAASATINSAVNIYTFGELSGIDTSSFSEGDELFVSTTAGVLTDTAPTGESSALQKIAKVTRSDASVGSITIMGAGRSNAVPNLNTGRLFVGNASNQAVADDTLYVDIANSRVGIGTTSPDSILHIEGSGVDSLRFGNIGQSSNSALRISRDDTTISGNPLGYLEFGGKDNTGNVDTAHAYIGAIAGSHAAGSNPTNLTFGTTPSGSSTISERMRIDESGKVGIGTDSPSTILGGNSLEVSNATGSEVIVFRDDGSAVADDFCGGFVIGNKDASGTPNHYAGMWADTDILGQMTLQFAGGRDKYEAGTADMVIDVNGQVGIGTASPAGILELSDAETLRFDLGTSGLNEILSVSGSADLSLRSGGSANVIFKNGSSEAMRIDSSGQVGIGNASPNAKFQVEEYGIDTTETSTTATTQVAIHTMSATTFRSARFTVQVTNSTDSTYHLTEILMIHDGTTPSITEYGTIFTGSAEATFDADISSGNVRLLATPASTDSMEFKVICHSITV